MVLHKNKWDKKASKLHEKKLSTKNKSDVAAEDKEKAEARALKNAAARQKITGTGPAAQRLAAEGPSIPTTTTSIQSQSKAQDPLPSGNASKDPVQGSGGEDDSEDEDRKTFSRRRKEQSNAWRYEEPEPEPGQEPEPEETNTEALELTKAKIKAIEEREAKAAKKAPLNMFDPDDDEFVKRYNRSRHTSSGKGKGNVVKVSRDSFKDVTDKMTKQATADDFRQRFGASKSGSSSRKVIPTDTFGVNDEDELDALISKISVEETKNELNSSSSRNNTTTSKQQVSSNVNGDNLDDDNWLDDRLK